MDVPQKNMSRLIVNKDLGERSKNMNSLEPKKLQICLTKMLEGRTYLCYVRRNAFGRCQT